MSKLITLAIPEAPPRALVHAVAERARPAGRLRLGVLDNSKPNAAALLQGLVERSAAATRFASVLFLAKPNAPSPAPPEILEQLATGADLVISAMGD